MRRRSPLAVAVIAVGFLLVGCGGEKKGEAEAGAAGTGAEGATVTCRADAFKGDPGLPANFPKPPEFVVTQSTQEGPTRVVVGYWESGLDYLREPDMFRSFVRYQRELLAEFLRLAERHEFTVINARQSISETFVTVRQEVERALKDRCKEDEVTYVRITSRPK